MRRWSQPVGVAAPAPRWAEGAEPGGRDEDDLGARKPAAGWTLTLDEAASGPEARRRHDSLSALTNGAMGLRGDLEDSFDPGRLVLATGAFGIAADGVVRPLPGPGWTNVGISPPDGRGRRMLDLRDGTLWRDVPGRGLHSVRFASLAHPGIGVLRIEDERRDDPWPDPLSAPERTHLAAEHSFRSDPLASPPWAETVSDRATVAMAARQCTWTTSARRGMERVVSVRSGRTSPRAQAVQALADAPREGFDELLGQHRQAWAERWEGADIEIVGDPASQLAIRFALFHLLSCAATQGEATVGARGLTGLAYAGHVFWDTDIFVLPALAATLPDAARAIIEYRIRRLPAARSHAVERGGCGARFPWESADTGEEVTPASMRDSRGRQIPVRTGEHAEHINADVAWSALHYAEWTADPGLMADGGRGLVIETARHWMGRIRRDPDGHGHIEDVIGPDEYHERVDDNAYTNGMARWHLRQAARVAAQQGDPAEASRFTGAAKSLFDGYDSASGRHEQFAGFDGLEPLLISEIAEPPVAADLLLGRDRVAHTQVVKQPDVLMLHHLLPDECPPGSLAADLEHYLPRTAHGSSLSPAICASLLARAGRSDEAMELFDLAARLDLDDLTGTTAAGLHLATMGGLWQAVVHGFAGIRLARDRLAVDPHLPSRWDALRVRVRFRGELVAITIDPKLITVEAANPVPMVIEGHATWGPLQVERSPDRRRPT